MRPDPALDTDAPACPPRAAQPNESVPSAAAPPAAPPAAGPDGPASTSVTEAGAVPAAGTAAPAAAADTAAKASRPAQAPRGQTTPLRAAVAGLPETRRPAASSDTAGAARRSRLLPGSSAATATTEAEPPAIAADVAAAPATATADPLSGEPAAPAAGGAGAGDPPADSLASPMQSRGELIAALLGVAAISVLVAFDSTIVSTTLPRVAEALSGMSLYAWVGTGYLLATAVTIPVVGRLGDLFGRKRLMLLSVALVAICSIASGLSQSMLHLVIARTLQGIGGGMMIATAFAAPADLLPDPRERVRWMALLSASFAVASGLGPILGGTVTQWLGWRYAFMVVPVFALPTIWVVYRYFPNLKPLTPTTGQRIDWLGGFLLMLVVGAPMLALELGFAENGHKPLALGLLLVGLAALALLLPYERRVPLPMLPMRVLSGRDVQLLNIAALIVGGVMFIMIYFGPLLLQNVLGASPSEAGLLMTPLVMSIPLASIINGYLFPRQSQPQRLMMLGALLLALGCVGALLLGPGISPVWALLVFALAGLGLGFLLPNLTLFMQMLAERSDVGLASGLIQTTRAVGSAVGIAIVGLLVTRSGVLDGVRAGMLGSILGCALVMVLASRLRMRNIVEASARSTPRRRRRRRRERDTP